MSLLVATRPNEQHRAVFDTGSFTPLLVGIVGGIVNVNPAFLAVGLLVYESAKSERLFYLMTGPDESAANKIADVLLGVGGYVLGEWLRTAHPDILSAIASSLEPTQETLTAS